MDDLIAHKADYSQCVALLQRHDFLVGHVDQAGHSLLYRAVKARAAGVVKALVGKGADIFKAQGLPVPRVHITPWDEALGQLPDVSMVEAIFEYASLSQKQWERCANDLLARARKSSKQDAIYALYRQAAENAGVPIEPLIPPPVIGLPPKSRGM